MPQPIDIIVEVDEEGRIPAERWRWMHTYLQLYAGRSARFRISSPKRSSKANSFYWVGIVQPIWVAATEAGIAATMQGIHDYYKQKFLPGRTEVIMGEEVVLRPTTTELDSTAFSDYIENIRNDVLTLTLGVYIEGPDDKYRSYNIEDLAY